MSTTAVHPTPISSRLLPVMLARASGAYFSGFCARLGREREVDDVLGQHGDQGQHRQGEALRDVELERLGGPGQEEGGRHDRQAEQGDAAGLRSGGCRSGPRRGPGRATATASPIAGRWATGRSGRRPDLRFRPDPGMPGPPGTGPQGAGTPVGPSRAFGGPRERGMTR